MNEDFLENLKQKLEEVQNEKSGTNLLMGYPRASVTEARKMNPPAKESAVMFLLFRRSNKWHTLFMKRPDGGGVHSNQLSFPGGKMEGHESAVETALRETREEVGIHESNIQIIGKISELYIPPSHFIVQPFVGIIPNEPSFNINPAEVDYLIEEPLHNFMKDGIVGEKEIFLPQYNRSIQAKYFDVQGHTLWGATAMMVQEIRTIMGFEN